MTRLTRTAAVVAALSFVLGACGDETETPVANQDAEPPSTDGLGTTLEFTAIDINWEEKEASAAAGELAVTLINEGAIEHSWVVEGHEDDLRLHTMQTGATDEGVISLEAGSYTYYCDITGHRAAGMEGTLTVE